MLLLAGLTMPDWSRVRGQTKDSPWPSRLEVCRGIVDPTAVKIYGNHGATLTDFFATFSAFTWAKAPTRGSGGQYKKTEEREQNDLICMELSTKASISFYSVCSLKRNAGRVYLLCEIVFNFLSTILRRQTCVLYLKSWFLFKLRINY